MKTQVLAFTGWTFEQDEIRTDFALDDRLFFRCRHSIRDEQGFCLGQCADELIKTYAPLLGLADLEALLGFFDNRQTRAEVRAFFLPARDLDIWREIFVGSLAEAVFRRGGKHGVELSASGAANLEPRSAPLAEQAILLNSGGKDTAVAARLLQQLGVPFSWFSFDNYLVSANRRAAEALAAKDGRRHFRAKTRMQTRVGWRRDFSPWPRERLRRLGYRLCFGFRRPLGNSVVMPRLAIAGALLAEAFGCKYVVQASERSADFGSFSYDGREINHQYQKSLVCELGLTDILRGSANPQLQFVSLLRPLYDLQVARLFAQSPELLGKFQSCNRDAGWCGSCPKCAFVFLALSPFVALDALVAVFGRNLLDDPALLPVYRALLNVEGHKPLECVGTPDECRLALFLVHQTSPGLAVVQALAEHLPSQSDARRLEVQVLGAFGERHALPEAWALFLRAKLQALPGLVR